jgi:hypothetical protein
MKSKGPQSGRVTIRGLAFIFACTGLPWLLLAAPVPTGKPAAYPGWWFERDVLPRLDSGVTNPAWPGDYPAADDYVLVNQGQVKHIASQAYAELNVRLTNGAGTNLTALINGFTTNNNYDLANVGQLKAVAKPFYDRLIEAGYTNSYPWSTGTDDYVIANIGQVKNVFSFDLTTFAAPSAPTGLTAIEWDNGNVGLTWTDTSSNETGFLIERSDDNGQTWTSIVTISANSTGYTVADSQAGTSGVSLFRVRSVNEAGSSSNSAGQTAPLDPNGDRDNDGLSNIEEIESGNGTAGIDDTDSDNDDVPDGADGFSSDPHLYPPRLHCRYAVIPIAPTSTYTAVAFVNDKGQAVLYSSTGNLYFWSEGTATAIPLALVAGLNNSGVVCGRTTDTAEGRAAKWSVAGGLSILPMQNPGAGTAIYEGSFASDINDSNEVIGTIAGRWHRPSNPPQTGVLYHYGVKWGEGGVTKYSEWVEDGEGGTVFNPSGINNQGVAIGFIGGNGYVWNGSFTQLPAEGWENGGSSINNLASPTIVGIDNDADYVYWTKDNGQWQRKVIESLVPGESPEPVVMPGFKVNDRMEGAAGSLIWRNGLLQNLQPLVNGWTGVSGNAISDHGIIGATAINPDDDTAYAVLLLPAEIIPNFNRDETIDLTGSKDRGKITTDKPYPLWINDDNDSGDLSGDDVPGGGSNATNTVVDGSRDLVDFAPLFLDIKTMLDVLPPSSCTYKLKQEDGAVNFVYSDLTPDHAKDYLTINTENQVETYGPSFNQKPNVATTTQVTSSGVTLNTTFLDKIKDEGKGVILVEGRSASTKPLIVEVYKGTDKMGEFSFPLKITTVDKMFRHKNLRPDNAGWATAMGEPENFKDANTSGKYFLFLHGYNVSSSSAKGWSAETFKRMYWAGSRARFVGVTWYGNQTQVGPVAPNYHINVINAQLAAQGLASTVNGLSGEVHAAGHSLGNMVVSTAISDYGANISDYYMLNAAVAMESYDGSVQTADMWHNEWTDNPGDNPTHTAYDSRLLCSNWHDRFASSDHRSKLTWRDRLSNTGGTHYYNFYSSSENVLGNHTGNAPAVNEVLFTEIATAFGAAMSGQSSDTQGEFAWAYQEKLKGLSSWKILGSSYGGWAFNWVDWGIPTDPQHTIFRERYPGETGPVLADLNELKTKPFFFKGVSEADEVFTTNGSAYAQANRNKLLAEMVPALSDAAGANAVNGLGANNNFNMPSLYKNGWPSSRNQAGRWLHSDLKTIGYPYIYPMYDEIVELGELDK